MPLSQVSGYLLPVSVSNSDPAFASLPGFHLTCYLYPLKPSIPLPDNFRLLVSQTVTHRIPLDNITQLNFDCFLRRPSSKCPFLSCQSPHHVRSIVFCLKCFLFRQVCSRWPNMPNRLRSPFKPQSYHHNGTPNYDQNLNNFQQYLWIKTFSVSTSIFPHLSLTPQGTYLVVFCSKLKCLFYKQLSHRFGSGVFSSPTKASSFAWCFLP